jgi:Tol biopolymer transport system component
LAAFVLLLLAGVIAGCGSQGSSVRGPSSSIVSFDSGRALDGSNAANASATGNIWTVKADGSGATPLTKLTAFGASSSNAVWSPGGSKIAFLSGRAFDGSDAKDASGILNIWVMNADGSGANALTRLNTSGIDIPTPVWSPDGSKIAFSSFRALDGSDALSSPRALNIWVMNADGTGVTPLTKYTTGGLSNVTPVWSPDSAKLAFISDGALDGSNQSNCSPQPCVGKPNVWVMNANGSGATPLTRFLVAETRSPGWSPDGHKVAFAARAALDGSDSLSGDQNIWVINPDGTGRTPLTKLTSGVTADHPVWSPNSSRLAFESDQDPSGNSTFVDGTGTLNIWVINADGSGATALTKLVTSDFADSRTPAWSSDGSKLAYWSGRALDGSNHANCTSTPPSTCTGVTNIWVVNADGSNSAALTKLTATASGSFAPQWHP